MEAYGIPWDRSKPFVEWHQAMFSQSATSYGAYIPPVPWSSLLDEGDTETGEAEADES